MSWPIDGQFSAEHHVTAGSHPSYWAQNLQVQTPGSSSQETAVAELRNAGGRDLAGCAVDELEPERGRALPEASKHARALLGMVGVGARMVVDEVPFQSVIDEDRELARGGRDGLGFANPGRPTVDRTPPARSACDRGSSRSFAGWSPRDWRTVASES